MAAPVLRAVTRRASSGAVPRPFLKWAGGKGQLLGELLPRVRAGLGAGGYHEPFIGGGALFFELSRQGALPRRATLSDANENLVEVYLAVRDELGAVVEVLREHKARHSEEHYYGVRGRRPESRPERAARVIYLNKTCFNGLYRENSRGQFNVPMGRYENPEVLDEPNLRAASEALRGVSIAVADFGDVAGRAEPGDLVYFDPPYDPVSKTSSFTSYAKGGFGSSEQARLRDLARTLSGRGVRFLLSNSMTPLVRELYAEFHVETVLATRAVNSRADRRGKIEEALVSNYLRPDLAHHPDSPEVGRELLAASVG